MHFLVLTIHIRIYIHEKLIPAYLLLNYLSADFRYLYIPIRDGGLEDRPRSRGGLETYF